jgi:hypothetical protein
MSPSPDPILLQTALKRWRNPRALRPDDLRRRAERDVPEGQPRVRFISSVTLRTDAALSDAGS